MKSTVTVAGLAALALAGCAPEPAADTSRVAIEVVAVEVVAVEVRDIAHQIVAAYNARDAGKAVSFDAPDYVGMFHGGPVTNGPADDLATMKQQMADPAVKFVLGKEAVDVAMSGDLAVFRAGYAFSYTDPGSGRIVTEHGNWLAGFKRQPDGTLKLAWTAGAEMPPATPPVALKP